MALIYVNATDDPTLFGPINPCSVRFALCLRNSPNMSIEYTRAAQQALHNIRMANFAAQFLNPTPTRPRAGFEFGYGSASTDNLFFCFTKCGDGPDCVKWRYSVLLKQTYPDFFRRMEAEEIRLADVTQLAFGEDGVWIAMSMERMCNRPPNSGIGC